MEYAVIGWLTRGESVSVQNQRGAWYDIGAGWIHSKYCEVKP
ncbi:MAG: SH3 domain-containing protein [Chloroflexi bacterium]|nr:SH3 domain-containing protein [Chloroflexota bacterium]